MTRVPSALRTTFLVHAIVAAVFGLQHLLVPRVWTDLAGMEVAETTTWRGIGAALVAFAVSSWLARREDSWVRVRILVAMDVVFSALGAAVIVWGIVAEGLPPLEWLNAVLLGLFAAAFAAFLVKVGWNPGATAPPPATLAG